MSYPTDAESFWAIGCAECDWFDYSDDECKYEMVSGAVIHHIRLKHMLKSGPMGFRLTKAPTKDDIKLLYLQLVRSWQ
jgi:hypothetical protein